MKLLRNLFPPIPRGRLSNTSREDLFALFRSLISPLDSTSAVADFEREFADFVGRKYCVAFPFVRTAIHAALKSLELPVGEKILMPPITIKPILDVVVSFGLQPVYVDLSTESAFWNVEELRRVVASERPRVAILTYLFGVIPDTDAVMEILRGENVFVIEDFSQALSAGNKESRPGRHGDLSVVSLSSTKTLDIYGGGMALTDDPKLFRTIQAEQAVLKPASRQILMKSIVKNLIRNLATARPIFSLLTYPLIRIGYRFRPDAIRRYTGRRSTLPLASLPDEWFHKFSSVQAVLGSIRLQKFESKELRRKKIALRYVEQAQRSNRRVIGSSLINDSNFWQAVMLVDDFSAFSKHLSKHRVDTATTSLSFLPSLRGYSGGRETPGARLIWECGAFLPCNHRLSDGDVRRVLIGIESY